MPSHRHGTQKDPGGSGQVHRQRGLFSALSTFDALGFSSREIAVEKPSGDRDGRNPNANDRDGGRAVRGLIQRGRRRGAMLGHEIGRDQADRHHDPDRHEDQVVEIACDRDEVGNEVEGRKRIRGDRGGQGLRVPRHAWITARQIKGVNITPHVARPTPQPVRRRCASEAARQDSLGREPWRRSSVIRRAATPRERGLPPIALAWRMPRGSTRGHGRFEYPQCIGTPSSHAPEPRAASGRWQAKRQGGRP